MTAVNGKIYAAGYFTQSGDDTIKLIASWDGFSWSPLVSGVGGSFPTGETNVNDLVYDWTNSKLYVGGGFQIAGDKFSPAFAVWSHPDDATVIFSKNHQIIPSEFKLRQNYPNPFNPSTTIEFVLTNPGQVRIHLYNMLGQKIKTIHNRRMIAGDHKVKLIAQNLDSGIYYYRIEIGDFQDVKKMILLK